MMSYDKYERGRQQLNGANGGHQRITYKKIYIYIIKIKITITLRLTQSNQWVGGRPCRSNSFAELSTSDW